MAQSRLGNTQEAKKQLDDAVERSKEQSATWNVFIAIEYELLQREAASLLEPAQCVGCAEPAAGAGTLTSEMTRGGNLVCLRSTAARTEGRTFCWRAWHTRKDLRQH